MLFLEVGEITIRGFRLLFAVEGEDQIYAGYLLRFGEFLFVGWLLIQDFCVVLLYFVHLGQD